MNTVVSVHRYRNFFNFRDKNDSIVTVFKEKIINQFMFYEI